MHTLQRILGCSLSLLMFQVNAKETIKEDLVARKQQVLFLENKGQIVDQDGKHRGDIDYKLEAGGVVMFVGDGQLHYQWSRSPHPASPQGGSDVLGHLTPALSTSGEGGYIPGRNNIPSSLKEGQKTVTNFYRMDVELVGADKNAVVVAEGAQAYVENYYLPQCRNGATAHSYTRVTYKNVYPNIDWVVYVSRESKVMSGEPGASVSSLKYDFIVHAGGDVTQIKLRYDGATSLQIKDGALIAETPFGSIREEVPYSYYAGSKEEVSSSFVLNGNVLGYKLPTPLHLNPLQQDLIIDPGINWSTYYGGSNFELFGTLTTDSTASVYMSGATMSTNNIATSGAFQTTYTSGHVSGMVVKFDSTGTRQWGSYYGGSYWTYVFSTAADAFGAVYISGYTYDDGLGTSGTYMSSKSTVWSPIIIKFNGTNGSRAWATYLDSGSVGSGPLACNRAGNLYAAANTDMAGLATTGAFQTTINGVDPASILIKFNSDGTRQWATYYYMYVTTLTVDRDDNICMGGSSATTGIATTGAFSTTGPGAFIVKFSPTGARLWGTFCADNSNIYGLTCDVNNDIYIGGTTYSTTGIATSGAYKPTFTGGGFMGFLGKLNSSGTSRYWGTYYEIAALALSTDSKCNLYIYSSVNAATPGAITSNAYQSTYGGAGDAVLGIFTTHGARRYGTYFGGPAAEGNRSAEGVAMAVVKDKIYITGNTNSTSGISTSNAHQPVYGGDPFSSGYYGDFFLAQFQLDSQVFIKQPFKDTVLCGLDTMHIPYGVNRPFRPSNTFTFQLSDASGSFASPTNMGTASGSQRDSIFKWVVPANITSGTGYRVRVLASGPIDTAYEDYNIRLRPTAVVTAGSNSPICSGNDLNFTAPTTVPGVVFSWTGPVSFNSTVSNPTRVNAQTAHSGKYVVTTTLNGCTYKDSIVNVVVNLTPATTMVTTNAPICEGADLKLNVSNSTTGVTFSWTGPGFTSPLRNPVIASATKAASGTYIATSTLGPCTSSASLNVAVNVGPTLSAYPSPSNTLCTGKKLTMVALATPAGGGTAFQWQKGGVDVPGATASNYSPPTVTDGDMYSVKMTPAASYGCNAPINSNGVTITVLPDLSPSVTMKASDSNAWPGVLISFEATATDAGTSPKYQWKLNGKNVAGATSSIWSTTTLNNNDSVCVEVTSTYLCPQPATVTACKAVKVTTGIHDAANSKLRIWPNPVAGQLTIEGLSTGTAIQVSDVYGRVVYNGIAKQDKEQINTEELVPGNYILQVTDMQGRKDTYKLVKE